MILENLFPVLGTMEEISFWGNGLLVGNCCKTLKKVYEESFPLLTNDAVVFGC